jgi:hypothetical protein
MPYLPITMVEHSGERGGDDMSQVNGFNFKDVVVRPKNMVAPELLLAWTPSAPK